MYENGFKKEDVSVEWDGFDVMKETDIIVRAGDSLLLTVKVEGATYYPLTDIQGTVWGYVDSQNSIVAQWRYDAWGNAIGGNVSVPALARLRYRFQGREWSAATRLVNFRMRWYDSETGRWLSKDPIGLGGGLNLYAFCECSPIIFSDSYGEAAVLAPLAIPFLKPVAVGLATGIAYWGSGIISDAVSAHFRNGASHTPDERNWTKRPSGTNNPYKHTRPHPTDPGKIIYKDPHTGKDIVKRKPSDYKVNDMGK